MKALYIASNNTIYPSGGGPSTSPASMLVTITRGDDSSQSHANSPEWNVTDGRMQITLFPGEVALAYEGETWQVAWTWTDELAVTYTFYENYLVVAAGREPAIGEVAVDVGTNSYVTALEAAGYIVGREGVTTWNAADYESRIRALLLAAQRIDSMRLRGRKYDETQPMAFPRIYWGQGEQPYSSENERWSSRYINAGWIGQDVVPQAVKDAQCEEALAILVAGASDTDRIAMQAQGVTSVRIGDFYETYQPGGRTASSNTMVIRSMEAVALLRPYLAGSAKFA